MKKIIFLILIAFYPFLSHASISNRDCLGCHEKYEGFNHGNINCVRCHSDITSIPHDDKLKRPLCKSCHETSEKNHKRGVHGKKKIVCNDCHNVHFLNRDKKTCMDCHTNITHKGLLAKERHFKVFNCLACHGVAEKGNINVHIDTKNRDIIKIREIDRDGNKFLDHIEWDSMLHILKKEFGHAIEIKKYYDVKRSDPHLVSLKPATCTLCHSEKGIFDQAKITIKGKTSQIIIGDFRIFIHELPSIEDYKRTVHGKKGIKCSECHISDRYIDDKVCLSCHGKIYDVYKDSSHARDGAAKCTDCHNPHKIKSFKELSASERVMICARCHKDYLDNHRWLPHTVLHFKYLECSSCHSPNSKKSIVFNFALKDPEGLRPFTYRDFTSFLGEGVNIKKIIDLDNDGEISCNELTTFFNDIRKKHKKDVSINTSIVVTEVFHHYSEKNLKTKICTECHSLNAPFYDSMVIVIPERDQIHYIPAKGTILSAFPTSVFVDMCLIGESKIKHKDIMTFLMSDWKDKPRILNEFGYKLIDFVGLTIVFFIISAIGVHVILRILVKR
ncbi:MAG: cytochrome c3 family protein [Syntrophorhabdaceae bacterium]|nr:cytochrome c3 family protein [Syntrophorhabdaceae bacterium]